MHTHDPLLPASLTPITSSASDIVSLCSNHLLVSVMGAIYHVFCVVVQWLSNKAIATF